MARRDIDRLQGEIEELFTDLWRRHSVRRGESGLCEARLLRMTLPIAKRASRERAVAIVVRRLG